MRLDVTSSRYATPPGPVWDLDNTSLGGRVPHPLNGLASRMAPGGGVRGLAVRMWRALPEFQAVEGAGGAPLVDVGEVCAGAVGIAVAEELARVLALVVVVARC